MSTAVQILIRGTFKPLPGATATHVAANAWEVRVPKSEAVARTLRGTPTMAGFDEAVVLIGDEESVQCLATRESGAAVWLSVLLP